ncbi:hypothetical protein B0H14DRAFT_2787094 [Mycena olivaceomarginata]|nr:hypothetical protein B0H14DRAFT_2787094 [Mycena olivaceomarginata]
MLNLLVLHGYVQSAATVAHNTQKLRDTLDGVAVLHYVDGPPLVGGASRPWWFLGQNLEFDSSRGDSRWDDVVKWWSKELSERQYDGIIGLSQGSAMAALLLSMVNHPERVPGFSPSKKQDFKFGIFCSAVDDRDTIVRAARTIELHEKCHQSVLYRHDEGHAIPVGGHFPRLFLDFISDTTK